MNKRIFILGLDGLEYEIARKYTNLRQLEYGKIDITGTKKWTPLCWGCFLTGLPPEKVNLLLVKSGRFHLLGSDVKTIFNLASKAVWLFIPCLNPHPMYWDKALTQLMLDAIEKKSVYRVKYLEACYKLFNSQFKRVLNTVKKEWTIFMAHFNNPDMYQHVFICDKNHIEKFYSFLDKHISILKGYLSEDDLMFIVSDHGFKCEKGKLPQHTGYGFYSCNFRLNLENPKIWSFYKIVENILGRCK